MMDLKFLKELLSIPSVSTDVRSIAEALRMFKERLGGRIEMVRNRPLFRVGAGPVLLFGHVDVVPAPPSLFSPRIEGDRLIARGAIDMKSQLVAMMELFERFPDKFTFIINSDEELGGGQAEEIAKEKFEVVFLPDGGAGFKMITAQKGVLWIKAMIKGKPAHASRPWLGENALVKGFRIHEKIKNHFGTGWHNTAALTKIECSNALNQIPENAYFYYDVRYIGKPPFDPFKAFDGYEILVNARPFKTQVIPLHQRFINEAKNMGIEMPLEKEFGASDARFFDVPVIMFSPVGGGHHSNHEWISLSSLQRFLDLSVRVFRSNDIRRSRASERGKL